MLHRTFPGSPQDSWIQIETRWVAAISLTSSTAGARAALPRRSSGLSRAPDRNRPCSSCRSKAKRLCMSETISCQNLMPIPPTASLTIPSFGAIPSRVPLTSRTSRPRPTNRSRHPVTGRPTSSKADSRILNRLALGTKLCPSKSGLSRHLTRLQVKDWRAPSLAQLAGKALASSNALHRMKSRLPRSSWPVRISTLP